MKLSYVLSSILILSGYICRQIILASLDETDCVRKKKCYEEEERNILQTTKRMKAIWIYHILRRNCLLRHIIEGNIEVMGRRRRRRKQLPDDLNKKREDTLN